MLRRLRFIDLFCGAGGVSEGIERAGHEVIACVNHDLNAIMSHKTNHPKAKHYIEDIRTLDLSEIVNLVRKVRQLFPNDLICLWASLECTNHSKAKGGQSRDADSRTLAEHLFRYIDEIDPDYIWIENVREFMDWGPLQQKMAVNEKGELEFVLDKKGNPIWVPVKELKGIDHQKWVSNVKSRGYEYQHRLLDCANYDCYTHRIRYFAQFAKSGLPMEWPKMTNAKKGLKPLKPVRDVLDLQDHGEDIFERKKPLVEKTLERIYKGLIKFVPKGDDHFIAKYYGTGDNVSSIHEPCGTLTTKDRMNLVHVQHSFFDNQYSNSEPTSLEQPCGSLLTNPKQNLVNVEQAAWIENTNFSNVGSSIADPAPTLMACRKYHYLINPQFNNTGVGIDRPCFTLIAKMDKRPPYLVDVSQGEPSVVINEDDSPYTKKIKQFMIDNNIRAIKRRLLRMDELLRIQGFGDQYRLIGTQAEQKKYIGNSVPPPMVKALIEASAAAQQRVVQAELFA